MHYKKLRKKLLGKYYEGILVATLIALLPALALNIYSDLLFRARLMSQFSFFNEHKLHIAEELALRGEWLDSNYSRPSYQLAHAPSTKSQILPDYVNAGLSKQQERLNQRLAKQRTSLSRHDTYGMFSTEEMQVSELPSQKSLSRGNINKLKNYVITNGGDKASESLVISIESLLSQENQSESLERKNFMYMAGSTIYWFKPLDSSSDKHLSLLTFDARSSVKQKSQVLWFSCRPVTGNSGEANSTSEEIRKIEPLCR